MILEWGHVFFAAACGFAVGGCFMGWAARGYIDALEQESALRKIESGKLRELLGIKRAEIRQFVLLTEQLAEQPGFQAAVFAVISTEMVIDKARRP